MKFRKFFPERFGKDDTLQIMGMPCRKGFGDTLNVIIWNMYKGQMHGWEQDFRAMIEGNDLVLLQEAVLNTPFDPIFRNADKMEWVMARSYSDTSTNRCTGVKTGSRVKSAAQLFYVSPDVEPIIKTPKMLLATSYPMAEREEALLVINIHAVNFVSYDKFARQIAQLVEIIEKHEGPVILAGDFNTWSGRRYKSLQELAAKMELTEVQMPRKTRWTHLNRNLDHVFYKGLVLEKAEVLFNIQSSDHHPIAVRFKRS